MKVCAVIVGGGSSTRMQGTDKLFVEIGGMTVFERSIKAFDASDDISEIVAVTRPDRVAFVENICKKYRKVKAVAEGGANRFQSVQKGIAAASADAEYYAIHDAARPFVTGELISRTAAAAARFGAAAPGVLVTDTIKVVDSKMTVTDTPNRASLVAIATPQIFEAVLYRSVSKHESDSLDDCQLCERHGRKVQVVEGDANNFKITTKEDLKRARAMLGGNTMRVGHGYDVHRLVAGRKLILGGVSIEYETGLLGHSDADVLTHAVMDAMLGAAARGDIGKHFPDTSERYSGANSLELLRDVARLIGEKGLCVSNIDATVVCQSPKLAAYIDAMRANLALCAGCDKELVSVKATSEEGLGFTGEGRAIAAHAVALLKDLE